MDTIAELKKLVAANGVGTILTLLTQTAEAEGYAERVISAMRLAERRYDEEYNEQKGGEEE